MLQQQPVRIFIFTMTACSTCINTLRQRTKCCHDNNKARELQRINSSLTHDIFIAANHQLGPRPPQLSNQHWNERLTRQSSESSQSQTPCLDSTFQHATCCSIICCKVHTQHPSPHTHFATSFHQPKSRGTCNNTTTMHPVWPHSRCQQCCGWLEGLLLASWQDRG